MNNQYSHLSEAVEQLKARGFTQNFEVANETTLVGSQKEYTPKEVHVEEFHRFEGATNPADMSIIYALSTTAGTKGIIIDSFDSKASDQLSNFLQNAEKSK